MRERGERAAPTVSAREPGSDRAERSATPLRGGAVSTFAVEQFWPGSSDAERAGHVALVESAQVALAARGVVWRLWVDLPSDECCLFLVDAASADAVAGAWEAADLRHHRIVAVQLGWNVPALR